jgi:hypothetical protein
LKPAGETYTITLRALPGDSRPAIYRVRRLLKFALRACGLKCVMIQETPVQDPDNVIH